MVTRIAGTFAILVLLGSPLASLACFPSPDAKPSSSISVIGLPNRTAPAVVFVTGSFELYASVDAMLEALSDENRYILARHDLADALSSRLPLTEDLDSAELVQMVLRDRYRAPDKTRERQDLVARAESEIRYAMVELLDAARVAVWEDGAPLGWISRESFSEICFGGRKYRSHDGELIFGIVDWIS